MMMKQTLSKIFEDDCLATTKTGTFSSMWHIQALASVVVCNIHGVYPNVAPTIRSVVNVVVHPRTAVASVSELVGYIIMWTRTGPMPRMHSQWIPNHFVPCVSSSAVSHVGRFLEISSPNPEKMAPRSKHPIQSTISITCLQAKAIEQPHATTTSSKKRPFFSGTV